MKRLTLPVLAGLALVAAGCGSSSSSSPSTTADKGGGTGGMSGGAFHITMQQIQFQPSDATVKVGTKMMWQNEDSVQHNVVADNGAFKSDLFGKGGTYEWTAAKPGKYSYVCTVHPNMKGTITVTG